MRIALAAIIVLILLPQYSVAQSQRPEWIKASQLYQRFEDTKDLSYLQNSLYRCSAFNMVFGALFTRDRPNETIGSEMQELGFLLQKLGDLAGNKKIKSNGGNPDDSEITMDSPLYMGMVESYGQWLIFSYTNFGDYTGDPQIVEELTFCRTTLIANVPSLVATLE
jgi:hypothetical protein